MGKHYTKGKNYFITIIQILLMIVIIVSGYKIFKWIKDNNSNNKIQGSLLEHVKFVTDPSITEESSSNSDIMDFSYPLSINESTLGWIFVPGTDINYSLVQADDNDYYLWHSFDKSENSAGWIFIDYRNKFDGSDKNIIIYGHNRRDGSMFSTLKNILNKDWYSNSDNYTVTLYKPDETLKYSVFSVYQVSVDNFNNQTSFSSDEEFQNYLNNIKEKSIYNFNTDVDYTSSILTLSTCANDNKYRVVLHAKLIN